MTMTKQDFRNSVPEGSTFRSDYRLGGLLGFDATSVGDLGDFLAFFSADPLKLREVGLGTAGGQPFSGLARDVRLGSGLWLGHSRTFPELPITLSCAALAACLGSLSRWKVNLQPSLKSWVLWTMFSLRVSLYFALFCFPSTLTSQPVAAAEKHPTAWCCYHHASPLGWHWASDECDECPDTTLRIEAKYFNLGFIRPEHLVSHSLRVLQVFFFCKLHSGFPVSFTEERLLSGSGGCPSGSFPTVKHRISAAKPDWLSGFLITSLSQALLPWLLSVDRRPALGFLVVPIAFHLRIMEAAVLLGILNAAEIVFVALTQAGSFDLMAWLSLWYALPAVRP